MRAAQRLFQATVSNVATHRNGKITTGLQGIAVHPNPLPYLLSVYESTLDLFKNNDPSSIPSSAMYRQSVESLTRHRISIIQSAVQGHNGESNNESAIEHVEKQIGKGVIEEVIKVAEDERALVSDVLENKSYV